MTTTRNIEERIKTIAETDGDKLTQDMHNAALELDLDRDLSVWNSEFPPKKKNFDEIKERHGISANTFLSYVKYMTIRRHWYEKELMILRKIHDDEKFRKSVKREIAFFLTFLFVGWYIFYIFNC